MSEVESVGKVGTGMAGASLGTLSHLIGRRQGELGTLTQNAHKQPGYSWTFLLRQGWG